MDGMVCRCPDRRRKDFEKSPKTSATLPKEKVLSKIRSYLQLLGRRIDQIVSDYEQGPYKQEGMTTRLWNYVSTFSNMSGEKLQQIYSKLKQEQHVAGGGGPFLINGQAAAFMQRDLDVGKFETWKRRKRAETDASHIQNPSQRSVGNGTRLPDPNSSGILGPPPSDGRQFGNGRPYRMQPAGFPSKQGFSSGTK